jgi:hypothetical protein
MNINNGASRPGVPFVDGIAVPIDLQRTIEVRARLDGTFAIVLHFTAPENRLSFFIGGLQLQPNVESVYRAAGEEMSDLAGAHNDIHAGIVAAPHRRIGSIDGSGDGADFAGRAFR